MATPLQIAGWVLDAGWDGTDAVTATAIALLVGDPAKPGGLWGTGGADGPEQARAAYAAWQKDGFKAFRLYRSGQYLILVPTATAAVAGAQAARTARAVDVPGVTLPGVEPIAAAAGFLTSPDAWQRITKIIIGLILITAGVVWNTKRLAWDPTLGKIYDVDRVIDRQVRATST